MSIILSGLIHLFRPLLSSLSGALDCEGLGPWYFLLGLRIVAIFFANGPWDKAKEDVTCNWVEPLKDKSQAFCTALCNNRHFAISISATWGLVFLLNLLWVGLMRLSTPEEKKGEEKEKPPDKSKEKDKEGGLAIVATAPHSGVADISTVYTVGPRGLPGTGTTREEDDDYDDYDDYPYHLYYPYHPYWGRMGYMGEGYGPIMPFGPYGPGGYGGGEYGMPGVGGYGMPSGGRYGMPSGGGYNVPSDGGYSGPSDGGFSAPSEGGRNMPAEGTFTVLAEGGFSGSAEGGRAMPDEGGHVMPDDEGCSVPPNEGYGISASGGYSMPAGGGYGMPIRPGHTGKTKMPAHCYNTAQSKMGVGPMDCRQAKLATHQHNTPSLQGRIKQTKAASRSNETGQYKVPTKCAPIPSPYRGQYKMATKCRPVFESNMDGKENMALKRRQVHRNNMPNKSQAPVQQQLGQDSMATQSRPVDGQRMTPGPDVSPRPPFCCHNNAGCCSCAENTSCRPAAQGETPRQPSSGNASSAGSQEKAKKIITNLCGIPFFDIWVGFLLATEIIFLCVIIVLQMPSLLTRLWACFPNAPSCPPTVDCVVRGRAEKRVALWGLVLTCILFIIACSAYFYLRTCWNRACCKCCHEEAKENRVEANKPAGGGTGDVEGGGRPSGGGQ